MTEQWRILKIDFTSYLDFRDSLNLGIMRARRENLVPNTVVILRPLKSSVGTFFPRAVKKNLTTGYIGNKDIRLKQAYDVSGRNLIGRGMIVCLFYVSTENKSIPLLPEELLSKTLGGISASLSRDFQITCRYHPPNNVMIEKKKFCWSSVTFGEHVANLTINIQIKEPETDIVTNKIHLSPNEITDMPVVPNTERFTWLEKELGRSIFFEDVGKSVIKGIKNTYDVDFFSSEITEAEYLFAKEVFNLN